MSMVINYAHLAKAIEFYAAIGYEQIEVDWMIPHRICNATHNHHGGNFVTLDRNDEERVLVGSAEQGFLHAVVEGRIKPERLYMSVSPCFRRGDIGPINQEWFVKLELSAISLKDKTLFKHFMMDDAFELFRVLGAERNRLSLYHEEDLDVAKNIDIVHWQDQNTPMELGSYGYREIEGLTDYNFLLHYGTGLALPRFQLIQT